MHTDHLLAVAGAAWGIAVIDVATGAVLAEHDPQSPLSTASVGKILLLLEVADRILAGDLDPTEPLDRGDVTPIADSGLWQHLSVARLTVSDAAVLVGAVSDNLATNLLLQRVGLDAVRRWPKRLGLSDTDLHDQVRESRSEMDPPRLSTGTAADLVWLMQRLHVDDVDSSGVGPQVLRWLSTGADLSLVAAPFGLDPLARTADRGLYVVNKTGADLGVRADVGLVHSPRRTLAYAVLVNWGPVQDGDPCRDAVLYGMRHIGEQLRAITAAI